MSKPHEDRDVFAPNWGANHHTRRTIVFPTRGQIQDVRIIGKTRVNVLTNSCLWQADLSTGQIVSSRRLSQHNCVHMLSDDGAKVLTTHILRDHVLTQVDDSHSIILPSAPMTCAAADDTVVLNLCSETLHATSLHENTQIPLGDVALASKCCRTILFHGMMGGTVVAKNEKLIRTISFKLDTLNTTVPSVRCIDAEAMGPALYIHVGCQDGTMRTLRYDSSLLETMTLTQVASTTPCGSPIVKLRSHRNHVAFLSESGKFEVQDSLGVCVYSMETPPNVCFDLTQRFLVLSQGNLVHVLDHQHSRVPRRDNRRHRPKARGQGGIRIS